MLCVCGCPFEAHRHFHSGTYCGNHLYCNRFRRRTWWRTLGKRAIA